MLIRHSVRGQYDLRDFSFIPNVAQYADGSCMVKVGRTEVFCTVVLTPRKQNATSFQIGYEMFPTATPQLTLDCFPSFISESRAFLERIFHFVVPASLYETHTIKIHSHVLQDDGSAAVAAVSGISIALSMALNQIEEGFSLKKEVPLVLGITCASMKGELVLDIDREEEIQADAMALLAMTPQGTLVGAYMSGEPMSLPQWIKMMELGGYGIKKIAESQSSILRAA